MLPLLFLSAYAYAQPVYYGSGTPVPYYSQRPVAASQAVYATPSQAVYATSQAVYAQAAYQPPQAVYQPPQAVYQPPQAVYQPPQASAAFELSQATRAVNAGEVNYRGNNLFYNTAWTDLFPSADPSLASSIGNGLGRFAATAKAASAQMTEARIQREIDFFRATHPQMTREDQNALDDLILQRESARNQKIRRVVSAIPGTVFSNGVSFSSIFERRAIEDDARLAQNTLQDARKDIQADNNQENLIQLRNAQDDVQQADERHDAVTYDLLGTNFGPIFRKKASQTKLEVGYRNRRAAQAAFDKDPSEENRMNLQLASLFIRATEEEDEANKDEIVFRTLFPARNLGTLMASKIANSKNFQDESRLWLRYDRLKRQILLRKQAQVLQDKGASPVAQQMLGLSLYGPK